MPTKNNNIIKYNHGEKSMKFCKDLREHVTKIINYEKKKMIPLTTEEKIYHNKQKICYICRKEFNNNDKKNYKDINLYDIKDINLSEGISNNKCLDCKCCLDYIKIKNEILLLKCFNCNNYYKKKFNKDLIKNLKIHIVFVIMILINLFCC